MYGINSFRLMLTAGIFSCLSMPTYSADATISRAPILLDSGLYLEQAPAKVSQINTDVANLANYRISESVDTDGDGLSDDEDPYPLDSTRPFYGGLICKE